MKAKEKLNKQNFIIDNIKHLIARRNDLTNTKIVTKEEQQERCNLYTNIHKLIKNQNEGHRIKLKEKQFLSTGSFKKDFKALNQATKQWIPCLIVNSINMKTF